MLPDAFLCRMKSLLGEDYDAFLASFNRPRAPGLRMNPLRGGNPPAEYVTGRVPWEENGFYYDPAKRPGLDPRHDAGLYYLQEPSAMAPAVLLDACPGERVLDLCAAPGGKTTQLAAAMRCEGLLVANEIVPARAKILSQNIERMGISNALVLNMHPAALESRFPAFFDRVLVDAPCSGEGMFRKEDAAIRDWSPEQVNVCAERQSEILDSAAKLLRPGGRLVYSTCTFSPEENEGVISRFLLRHPDFSIETVPACALFSPGIPAAVAEPAPGIDHTFRLFPHRLVGEGHYAAVLRRSPDASAESLPAPLKRNRSGKTAACEALPAELQSFLRDTRLSLPPRRTAVFGDTLFLLPDECPELIGLKVLRAGLCLGVCRKGRFEPDHALAMWFGYDGASTDRALDDPDTAAYLRGESIPGGETGWLRLTAEGLPLGWVKGSGGQLKNHLPKGLRHPAI